MGNRLTRSTQTNHPTTTHQLPVLRARTVVPLEDLPTTLHAFPVGSKTPMFVYQARKVNNNGSRAFIDCYLAQPIGIHAVGTYVPSIIFFSNQMTLLLDFVDAMFFIDDDVELYNMNVNCVPVAA